MENVNFNLVSYLVNISADFPGCRVYRPENGEVRVRAARPLLGGTRRINSGEDLTLRNGETFSLCDDEWNILNEYQLRLSN